MTRSARRSARALYSFGSDARQWALRLRLWPVALLAAVMPATWAAGRIGAARRARAGFCAACGYDLRATPDRCPECGAVARGAPHDAPTQPAAAASSGAVE